MVGLSHDTMLSKPSAENTLLKYHDMENVIKINNERSKHTHRKGTKTSALFGQAVSDTGISVLIVELLIAQSFGHDRCSLYWSHQFAHDT